MEQTYNAMLQLMQVMPQQATAAKPVEKSTGREETSFQKLLAQKTKRDSGQDDVNEAQIGIAHV